MALVKKNIQLVDVVQVQIYDKPDTDVKIGIPLVRCRVKYQREGTAILQRAQNKLQNCGTHKPCVVGSNSICAATVEGNSIVILCALHQARCHAERRPTCKKLDQQTGAHRSLDIDDIITHLHVLAVTIYNLKIIVGEIFRLLDGSKDIESPVTSNALQMIWVEQKTTNIYLENVLTDKEMNWLLVYIEKHQSFPGMELRYRQITPSSPHQYPTSGAPST